MDFSRPVFWEMKVIGADRDHPVRWEARCPICREAWVMSPSEGANRWVEGKPVACAVCRADLLIPASTP